MNAFIRDGSHGRPRHTWALGILVLALTLAPSLVRGGSYASVTNVDIDNQGATAALLPGQTFTLGADYTVWNDAVCPSCILEVVIAIEMDGQACLYTGIPPLEPGLSGSGTVQLTAPSTPGIYAVRFGYELMYTCEEAIGVYEGRPQPGDAIGTIVVSNMDSAIENVDIDGQGGSANVAPGATFPVSLDYRVTNPGNCPACIAQLVVGVEADAQACAYDGIPPLFPGTSGSATVTLQAPSAPGVYAIRYGHHLQFGCAAAMAQYESNPPASNVLGTITVGGFHARVINCNIDGQGPHAAVQPGAACSVALDYTIWSSSECPTCIDQLVIGIGHDAQVCAYDGIPGVAPGVSGSAVVELIAPPSGGSYVIHYTIESQYSCSAALAEYESDPPLGNVAGTLEVAVPDAQRSWGSIKALYDK